MRWPDELPELEGRSLRAYKLLWWTILVVGLVALTAGQWRAAEETSRIELQIYRAGLLPSESTAELRFNPLSAAAREAGIEPDSELLAVNGQAASHDAASLARQLRGPDGQRITLRLRLPNGAVRDVQVVRSPQYLAAADRLSPTTHQQRTWIEIASSTLDALIVMAGAALLFWRRANDPVAALLSLGLLAVPASGIASLVNDTGLQALVENTLDVVPMASILLGLTVFPAGRFSPRWTLLILPAIAAWALLLLIGGDEAPLGLQLAIVLPGLIIAVGSLAWRYRRMEPGTPRQQLKWVMLGFAAFFVCGLLQFALLFVDGSVTDNWTHLAILLAVRLLVPLQGFCIVGGLLVSLLRYRLYDADAAISRSAVYGALTAMLFAIFAASETLIQTLGQRWLSDQAGVAGAATAAGLTAVLLFPLHHRLTDWAKKRFQKDLARLRAELPQVLVAVRDTNNPEAIADDSLRMAMRGVHASRGAILLVDESRLVVAHAEGLSEVGLAERLAGELPRDPQPGVTRAADASLPLRLPLVTEQGAHVGWLLLGPHPDGSFYGKDDRKALEMLAMPLARAFHVAMERARREAEREAERRTLVDRLAQLEDTLTRVVRLNGPPREAGTV